MLRWSAYLIAALSLACGSSEQTAQPPISTAAADATAPGQVARAASLLTQIKSAGQECDAVIRTFLQGEKDGGSVWNAECSNGRSYGVYSKPDGPQVLECSALETVTGAKCFTTF